MIEENGKYSTQKCPVCNGFGTLSFGRKTCHGCKGRGYIVIDNSTGLPVEDREIDEDQDILH